MADTYLKYVKLLRSLLPLGKAWNREEGSRTTTFLKAISKEFGRIEDRTLELVEEFDPRTAVKSLEDWERVLDLPDRCIEDPDSLTIEQRRNAILQKLTARGGQSLAYYEFVASQAGFNIDASNYAPFRASRSSAGDPLTNDLWLFWWNVNAPSTATYFSAGSGRAGDPLVVYGESVLECLIRKLKPAHTEVLFTYDV